MNLHVCKIHSMFAILINNLLSSSLVILLLIILEQILFQHT